MEHHDDRPHDREDFLAVPEDAPDPGGAPPRPRRARRRPGVRLLTLVGAGVGAAVLAGGVLVAAGTLGQGQGQSQDGAPVAAGATTAAAGSAEDDDRDGRPGWFDLDLFDDDGRDGDRDGDRGGGDRDDDDDGDRVVGALVSVDASSIVVDAPSGRQTLAIDDTTAVVRDHERVSTADLAVGQDVLVRAGAPGEAADVVVVDPSGDDR